VPNTSRIDLQAAEICYAILQGASNGQTSSQNLNIKIQGLAAAVMLIATGVNQIASNTNSLGTTIANAMGTQMVPGGSTWTTSATGVPANYTGTAADPISFPNVKNGTVPVNSRQP
jgi:hypothetical protein